LKKIWKLLKQHFAVDFNWKLYSAVAIFLAICVIVNYAINLENGIIDKDVAKPVRIVWYFMEMTFAYFGASLIVFYFSNTLHYFKSTRYWTITLITIFLLAVNLGFPYTWKLGAIIAGEHYYLFRWTYGVIDNLVNFVVQSFPLFVFAYFFEKKKERFGVNANSIDLKPYLQLLAIVLPLVIIASFEPGFAKYYPVYQRYQITDDVNTSGVPTWLFGLGFETAYGMDFFNVEFLFRGALVIGVSQVIGKEAILPMVAAYCALHFGKPWGECVSSIFGGYILGVVALYTRNIWGGVMVHVGLAWMMEVVAFIQRGFTQ
jgi:hypothetical protein